MRGSFAFHLRTFCMSSLVYQPTDLSFTSFFSFLWVSVRCLMNCSCQERLGNRLNGLERDPKLEATSTCGHLAKRKHFFCGKMISLSKPQAAYCFANTKWSPFRHSSWSHCGTCKRPPFLGSQRRLNLALSAFSSLFGQKHHGFQIHVGDAPNIDPCTLVEPMVWNFILIWPPKNITYFPKVIQFSFLLGPLRCFQQII